MTECAWCGSPVSAEHAVTVDNAPAHELCVPLLRRAKEIAAHGLSFEGVLRAR